MMEHAIELRLHGIPIPVPMVKRRLGYPSGSHVIEGEIRKLLDSELRRAPDLMEFRGIFRSFSFKVKGGVLLEDADFVIESKHVTRLLEPCAKAVLFMVTLGPNLDTQVQNLMAADDITRAVILDAIGSETADALADSMHHDVMGKEAAKHGFSVTARYSPGYGDWPVTVQKKMLQLCEGHRIGISVNDSYLMQPRKSVSAVLGWKRGG